MPPNADQLTQIQSEIQAANGTALIFTADVTTLHLSKMPLHR
ncbi:MAG: hypothetical protein ACR2LR_06530 [Hassallia sp.]